MKKFIVGIICLGLIGIFISSLFGSKNNTEVARKNIAIIKIQGPLYGMTVDSLTGRINGADAIMNQLISARDDASIVGVLIRMDTPGGSVTAAEEIAAEIEKLRSKGKYVVTSMGDTAASAGYWLASCTDYIFANPSTLTGSIGVYIPYMNIEELYKKIGVSQNRIKSGAFKDMLATDRPMREDERKVLQTMVDEMYDSFVKQIAKGRNLSEEKVRELADGRIYTGKQAKELALVDELGNYYDALDFIAKKLGIEGKPYIKEYHEPFSWRNMLKMGMLNELADILVMGKNDVIQYKGFY